MTERYSIERLLADPDYTGKGAPRTPIPRVRVERERPEGKKWLGDILIDDEATEQQHCFDLTRLQIAREACPDLEYFHHIPNGGKRPKKVAGQMHAGGTVSGALDLRWDLHRPMPDWRGAEVRSAAAITRLVGPRPPVMVRSLARELVASGLVVELKAGDNCASKKQARWLVWLAEQKFACFLAWSGVDAFNLASYYGGLPLWADRDSHVHRGARPADLFTGATIAPHLPRGDARRCRS